MAELAAAGFSFPGDIDPEVLCLLPGLGSTGPRSGKEMDAIRTANFLIGTDPDGAAWIEFKKEAPKPGQEDLGRAGRTGGRR